MAEDNLYTVKETDESGSKYFKTSGTGTKENPYVWKADVMIQDQSSPTVIIPFNKITGTTTLAVQASIDSFSVTVASNVGMVVGQIFIMFSVPNSRFFISHILAINANVISLTTAIDFDFEIGANVEFGTDNMAVNGSVTPQIFGLRGLATPAGIDSVFDITRLIWTVTTTDPVNLSTFGDIVGGISKSMLLRKRNGTYQNNILDYRTNGEMAGLMYDFTVFSSTNPAQGQNGFTARLTFAGQEKMGVTQRLPLGRDLEFIIASDISSILDYRVVAEGHIVEGES